MATLVLLAVFKITLLLRTTPRTPLSNALTLAVAMVAVAAGDVAKMAVAVAVAMASLRHHLLNHLRNRRFLEVSP